MRAEPSCPLAQHRCDCSATLSKSGLGRVTTRSGPLERGRAGSIWPESGKSEKFVPLSRSCLED